MYVLLQGKGLERGGRCQERGEEGEGREGIEEGEGEIKPEEGERRELREGRQDRWRAVS